MITLTGVGKSCTSEVRIGPVDLTILRQENHFITRLTVRQLVGFGRFP